MPSTSTHPPETHHTWLLNFSHVLNFMDNFIKKREIGQKLSLGPIYVIFVSFFSIGDLDRKEKFKQFVKVLAK